MGRRRREGPAIEYIGGLKEESTAFAGLVLLLDVYREAGIGKTVERVLPQKRSPKGLRQEQIVEVFVAPRITCRGYCKHLWYMLTSCGRSIKECGIGASSA